MNKHTRITFDESLPRLAKALKAELGSGTVETGVFVRDANGRLMFLTTQQPPSQNDRQLLESKLLECIGPYAHPEGIIAFGDELWVEPLLKDESAIPIQINNFTVRLLDRRIVGSTWTVRPNDSTLTTPCIVFASLKGGVGRSTALALTAADFARKNKNVLVVDLDLEAPGIGSILLDDERLPQFGLIDYFVDNSLQLISDKDLSSFVGNSQLTQANGGRVDILPALGKIALSNPGNTMPKLSRAMLEEIDNNGEILSLSMKVERMIRTFASRESYDVILVDARAGMSEFSAPPILGLGAHVLFFGTAQKQTIQGYSALFAAFKLLVQRELAVGGDADWRLLFRPVLAKASANSRTLEWFQDEMYEIYADNFYESDDIDSLDGDRFTYSIDDKEAPHWPFVIAFDSTFADFDPAQTPAQLQTPFYERAFKPFLDGIEDLVSAQLSNIQNRSNK